MDTEKMAHKNSSLPQITGFKKYWIKDHYHVIGWFLIYGLFFSGYLILHTELKNDYQASEDVISSIDSSTLSFQMRKNNLTHKYELTYEGRSIDLEALESGALVIAKLASARGLIFDAVTRIENYNLSLEGYLIEIASSFKAVLGEPGYFDIPLHALEFGGLKVGDKPGDNYVFRVNAGVGVNPATYIEGNERGARRLERLLAGGIIKDTSKRTLESGEIINLKINTSKLKGATKEALDNIKKEISEPKLELAYQTITDKTIDGSNVGKHVRNKISEIIQPIKLYFHPCPASADKQSPCNKDDNFYIKIKKIFNAELGFFWSFGHYLWFEIVLLTMLGVMTEGSTRLSMQFTGRAPDKILWDPRESARTLLKLISAPITAMVVIWTMMFTDLINTDTKIEKGGFSVFVPLAFMLGLFPNLGYSLLKRLAEAIFVNTSVAKPTKRGEGKKIRATPTKRPPAGEPPDFNAVKKKAVEHSTSIIKK